MFKKPKTELSSSAFSDFIRNAPSRKKKRVFTEVLKGAAERQRKQVELADAKS